MSMGRREAKQLSSSRKDPLVVYVPSPSGTLGARVKAGSALVGTGEKDETGYTQVYFEGNMYGAVNLEAFTDKLRCAADRLQEKCPTVAKTHVPITELVEVGTYTEGRITVTNIEALRGWIGKDEFSKLPGPPMTQRR